MNVVWKNSFRHIFQCCWRESVSCLLYYCKVLPMSYISDQRNLLFRTGDNSVIRSFSILCTHEYGKILSRYNIQNLCSSTAELKRSLWQHFVDSNFQYYLNCNPLFVLLCGVLCVCVFWFLCSIDCIILYVSFILATIGVVINDNNKISAVSLA